jgi:hypothetical protein
LLSDATRPEHRLVQFRAMLPSDVPGVGAVERASYTFPWSEGIFRDCLRVGLVSAIFEYPQSEAAQGEAVAALVMPSIGRNELPLWVFHRTTSASSEAKKRPKPLREVLAQRRW